MGQKPHSRERDELCKGLRGGTTVRDMCGFVGILRRDGQKVRSEDVARMCLALRHRGPDDHGLHIGQGHEPETSTPVSVGLGHQRLSIIDLSQAARQPMENEDRSLWVVCNGEIYNHKTLRQSLIAKGHCFRSHSDTEVVLHLYEEVGPRCVDHLRGMFALVIWDSGQGTMFLARDRLGQKPLYYYSDEYLFVCASEINAILQAPGLDLKADQGAIDCYFKYGYIVGERTPYERIRKLPPAFRMSVGKGRKNKERYWHVPLPAASPSFTQSVNCAEEFDTIFSEAVRLRLESDVPLGAFLSGGIDSSAIVSKMVDESGQSVKTFAIGFSETSFDERSNAREVASLLGTRHRDHAVDFDIHKLLPKMVRHFGEPFADSSALATYHLARVTRQHVTVALSGDGGDELLCGYNRYLGRKLLEYYFRCPKKIRNAVFEKIVSRLREGDEYYGRSFIKKVKLLMAQAKRLEKSRLAFLPQVFDASQRRALLGRDEDTGECEAPIDPVLQYASSRDHVDSVSQMMWADLHTYLPDDILVKVDRMSMAHALEVRSPFLDHKLVEFVAALPIEEKLRGLTTKYLLKQAMKKKLPPAIIYRKKHGFMVPLARWFKKELKPLICDCLLAGNAPVDQAIPKRLMTEHCMGTADHSHKLWVLLMYTLWKSHERTEHLLQA